MKVSLKNWLFSTAVLYKHHLAYASEEITSPTLPPVATAAPFVGGRVFINGVVQDAPSDMKLADVYESCATAALLADRCPNDTNREYQRLLT